MIVQSKTIEVYFFNGKTYSNPAFLNEGDEISIAVINQDNKIRKVIPHQRLNKLEEYARCFVSPTDSHLIIVRQEYYDKTLSKLIEENHKNSRRQA